jgi:hypothetical protein
LLTEGVLLYDLAILEAENVHAFCLSQAAFVVCSPEGPSRHSLIADAEMSMVGPYRVGHARPDAFERLGNSFSTLDTGSEYLWARYCEKDAIIREMAQHSLNVMTIEGVESLFQHTLFNYWAGMFVHVFFLYRRACGTCRSRYIG